MTFVQGTAALYAGTSVKAFQKVTFRFSFSQGTYAFGDTWTVTLNGQSYQFVGGKGGDSPDVAPVDIRLIDNDVPTVEVTQTDGSTNVTESSDSTYVGNGKVLEQATTDTSFKGTFGLAEIDETASVHDSFDSAQSLDYGQWSNEFDAAIDAPGTTSVLAHTSVIAQGDNTVDMYQFTVSKAQLDAAAGRRLGKQADPLRLDRSNPRLRPRVLELARSHQGWNRKRELAR